jgi:hypothetical protein
MVMAVAIAGPRSVPAHGAGSDHDSKVAAAAEALFQEGKRLLERGDSAAACPKLAESLRLERATGTLFALAMCHEAEGRLASGWAEYAEVVARAEREGRADREQAARKSMRALEPRLSTLTILVPGAASAVPGLRVERDQIALEAPSWSTAVPIDPGPHVVTASAPGYRSWRTSIEIGAVGDRRAISIPVLDRQVSPATSDARAPSLAAGPQVGGSAPLAPVTIALLAGVAAGSTSPAVVAELAAARQSGWGGALRAAWLVSSRQQAIDSQGEVTLHSYAFWACAFRRFRAEGPVAFEAGPEILLQLDRAQTTGLGGLAPASRAAWGLGLQGAADVRLTRWLSLSVVASADYAPAGWAGTFEVTNRGEVLRPAAFRVLLGVGPRFALDW